MLDAVYSVKSEVKSSGMRRRALLEATDGGIVQNGGVGNCHDLLLLLGMECIAFAATTINPRVRAATSWVRL